MQFFYKCLILLVISCLTACGGGGSGGTTAPTSPTSSSSSTSLKVDAPSSLALPLGQSVAYSISGAGGSYTAVSSAPGVVAVVVRGSEVTLAASAVGTASIKIIPAQGSERFEMTVVVTAPSEVPLYTSAPTGILLVSGTTRSVEVGGGLPPYRVQSSNLGVATVAIVNGSLNITSVADGSATVVVTDGAGKQVSFNVTVSSSVNTGGTSSTPQTPVDLYTTAPSSIVLTAIGSTRSFDIGGGITPYRVQSSNTGVATATTAASGTALSITSVADGSASIVVTDGSGKQVSFTVAVISSSPSTGSTTTTPTPIELYTTAPASITMASALTRTFDIGGGTLPYRVQASNTGVVTTAVSGASFTLTSVVDGSATVVISDALGKQVSFSVVVITTSTTTGNTTAPTPIALYTTAPTSVAMSPAMTRNFDVGGGVLPYRVQSSNTGVVTTTISGTVLTVTALADGASSIVVTDGVGKQVSFEVTVASAGSATGVPPLSMGASTISIPVDLPQGARVRIVGGVAPFNVTSGIPSAVTATVVPVSSYYEINITPLLVTSGVDVLVVDAAGQSAKVSVEVTSATPSIRIAPSTLVISEGYTNQQIQFSVIGATGNSYRVFSSDVSRITAPVGVQAAGLYNFNLSTTAGLAVILDTDIVITVIDSANRMGTAVITVKDTAP